jgi:putative phosphoribosyl transferase
MIGAADLTVPHGAKGVVLFAHGSGSSRHSPRNRYVAGVLNKAGLATLLIDLLTPQEDEERANRFDIGLLVERLTGAVRHLQAEPRTAKLPIGVFGASTGAGAALELAAARPEQVRAVVSRGGRPDLASHAALSSVKAATLLIVGGDDTGVIELNEQAYAALGCEKRLEIVPGATHLFEEPGTLEEVARLAAQWFTRHLEAAAPLSQKGAKQ